MKRKTAVKNEESVESKLKRLSKLQEEILAEQADPSRHDPHYKDKILEVIKLRRFFVRYGKNKRL